MSTTKLNLLILAIILGIVAFVTVLFWPLPQPPKPPVKSTFIGFTNGPRGFGPGAAFSLSNYPRQESYFPQVREIAFKEDGVWKKVTPVGGRWPSIGMSYTDHSGYILSLYLANTNQPMRAILEWPAETSGGVREMVQRIFRRLTSRGAAKPGSAEQRKVRQRSLSFTNETTIAP